MTKAPTKTAEKTDEETGEIKQLPAVVEPGSSPPAPMQTAAPAGLPTTGFANLATAIALVTAGIADPENRVSKSGHNKFQNYNYASMQDILQKLSPLMAQQGIVIMQSELTRSYVDDGAAISITYDFTIIHKSGEVWPQKQQFTGLSKCRDTKGGFDDKSINKCHTAARKYFLLALFQIPTEDENDPDAHDTSSGKGNYARKPDVQTKAELEEPVGKLAPHAIPYEGKKFVGWGGEYVAQINLCATVPEVMDYKNLNEETLTVIATQAPPVFKRIEEVTKARLVALT